MTIFFSEHSKWERDYINNELLSGIDLTGKNVLIINHATPIEIVKQLVAEHVPQIVFHLSDEGGDHGEWLYIFGSAKYVFRQYNHAHYVYPPNSIQMPLGYASGYNKTATVKPVVERIYKAAFIGELKSDRFEMFDAFEKGFVKEELFLRATRNEWELPTLQYSPSATNEVYSDSIFVPIGRGNQSLDCFRFYEAIVSGAIPVVVGDINEINMTFQYDGHMPSFLYTKNWADAATACKHLIKTQFPALMAIQQHNIDWWDTQVQKIRHLIERA
jgi:hypothetical protein